MKSLHITQSLSTLFWVACLLLWFTACNGRQTDIYLPSTRAPTQPPTATNPASAVPPTIPAPTPTTVCTNHLTFVEDVTIPDGSEVESGVRIDKRWLVKNDGDCNWDASYRLKLVTGPALGVTEELALYPARGGSEATIRVVFTAPAEAGTYRSAWQAIGPDGQAFGDAVYIEIVVP